MHKGLSTPRYGTAFLGMPISNNNSMYQPRTYRHRVKNEDLVSFEVVVRETDLHISACNNLESSAMESVLRHRQPIERYIQEHPLFWHTLEPCIVEDNAPAIVKRMAEAGDVAGVGPMAAIAGAIAEYVGNDLLEHCSEVIVENGGDIFMKTERIRRVGIFAGEDSPFTHKISLEIKPEDTPLGVCTSSGTVGHSLSFGSADAVIVLSSSAALADAVATAICNKIKTVDDINTQIAQAGIYYGISGLVIIKEDKIGIWGNVKLAD